MISNTPNLSILYAQLAMTDSGSDPQFEALLEYIKRSRGFDFTGYKRSTLMRRVTKRMYSVGIERYGDYLDFLEVHPEEFVHLFNTLLINVTAFFRDESAWEYIQSEILPQIVAQKGLDDTIRVWSAGCASGEEAYTIAMIIAEVIGAEQFPNRVKIYATDADDEALNYARQASYLAREVEGIRPELLERYFELADTRYVFRKDLRRCVIFGRHDLIQDAPISKIDLLICRNTLMYFNAETQARILARFHFGLQDRGFLFLGKAEMLLAHTNTFIPADLKRRVFKKVPKVNSRDRLLLMALNGQGDMEEPMSNSTRLRESAFNNHEIAEIIVDDIGTLAVANERARVLFNINPRDIGRPLQDIELSYRPVELRSRINQAYSDRQPISIQDVEWQSPAGEIIYFDVQISPLSDLPGNLLGVSISFNDVSRYKRLQEELEHSNQELEMAYEELQSTNEELETTNEELQSANEELETTNEELQSTNEELETMNEELQSTNEELQTVNAELQRRSEELNDTNSFLEAILISLKGAVVVVNRDLQVQIWNYKAEDLWGLRTEEAIGQNFLNLDIGLPVEQLRPAIRSCLNPNNGSSDITVSAINRRGRTIQCCVACSPLINSDQEILGVILLMEERDD